MKASLFGRARAASSIVKEYWPGRLLLTRYDGLRFRPVRKHYYEYLAALLGSTQGARTLKQVFAADARRYGPGSLRGRLSAHWLDRFETAGGDLYATWLGVFPVSELAVLRSAQARGNATLVATLGEMSRVLGVLEQAAAILRTSLLTAGLAFLVWIATLLAMPAFTVPRLRDSFSIIPPEYHGRAASRLFHWSDLVAEYAIPILAAALLCAWMVMWSFRNFSGPLRRRLDPWGPWRIYRQVHALQFLALLGVALGTDEHGTTRLRQAFMLQLPGASPWFAGHVRSMVQHVDIGRQGAALFDTGLLDDAQLWFLDDMVAALGLVAGLRACANWVEAHVLGAVARQAQILRWCMLLAAVAGVLALGLWHYAAIDDLRRGIAIFHATQ